MAEQREQFERRVEELVARFEKEVEQERVGYSTLPQEDAGR